MNRDFQGARKRRMMQGPTMDDDILVAVDTAYSALLGVEGISSEEGEMERLLRDALTAVIRLRDFVHP